MRWQVRLECPARRKPSWKATIEHADPIVPEITQQPPDVRGVKPLTAAGIVIGDQQMFIADAKLGQSRGEYVRVRERVSPAATVGTFGGGQVTLEVKEDGPWNVPFFIGITARVRLAQQKTHIEHTHVQITVMLEQPIGGG